MSDFEPGVPAWTARAPGRLDVMGGIADYSGATVLQLPLARATRVSLQRLSAPRHDIATLRGGAWQHWTGAADERWARYVTGALDWALERAGERGAFRVRIESDVPEGMGVASSAALEVATMAAACAALGVAVPPEEMAAACQWVENHVVGAPCGIMDQMTSACGRADALLRLACRPATIEGFVAIPGGYRCFGLASGERHAVTGADYGTVRAAAFMGYRMIAAAEGLAARQADGRATIDDPRWHGYLANVDPAEYGDRFARLLPERMAGAEFLERYGGTTDAVTRVDPGVTYPVRAATNHPIREQQRVVRFADALGAIPREKGAADRAGALMYESHTSYRQCGLGSPGTDLLVRWCAEAGTDAGIYGARITGGGSGGTVAVLATAQAEPAIHEIARRYARETGKDAVVFAESGPGVSVTAARLA